MNTKTRSFKSRMNDEGGFSLIEIVVTIIIIGILALVVIPRLIQLISNSRGAAAEQTAISIEREARGLAAFEVGENRNVDPADFFGETLCVDIYEAFWDPSAAAGFLQPAAGQDDNTGNCYVDSQGAAGTVVLADGTDAPQNSTLVFDRGDADAAAESVYLVQDTEGEAWACILMPGDGDTGVPAEISSGAWDATPDSYGTLNATENTTTPFTLGADPFDADDCLDASGDLLPSP